ncbi:hypothetical protein SPF06_18675 [Sinomonas sp. JGH33]|uniref:Uncharacterized protein n=1 Tax=Sinomonas terricola TaxID=3110330 RepID=A0ABU5TAQ2_9MICC|nr:hypothetical protein [Sinomonas sp. JGH33]MEA5456753.1 hypothetical protein [Sinomonas sp. JGH33]
MQDLLCPVQDGEAQAFWAVFELGPGQEGGATEQHRDGLVLVSERKSMLEVRSRGAVDRGRGADECFRRV